MPARTAPTFATRLLRWFDRNGRKDFPWQNPRIPYRVWLSEVMLQQTSVTTVIPYFLRFVEKFPTLPTLAAASQDDVLALWSGLGYYSRARNLHRAAQICVEHHQNDLPRDIDALIKLPGIGRSTAGAIMAQAFEERFPILDANVKRVLSRFHGVHGSPGSTSTEHELWKNAEIHTPRRRIADYTQAIMDLGALICTPARPQCVVCPLSIDCFAYREGLTAKLPERKPTRTLPTRQTIMLVLRDNQGRLMLERRPPTGVWAQLWSLPEAIDVDAAKQSVRRDHGVRVGAIKFRPLPPFVHVFSHYRLDIVPLAFDIDRPTRVAEDSDRRWLYPAEAVALGLPAPVRKLIATFTEEF